MSDNEWTVQKLIIACAITGAEVTQEQCPHLPITPDEQAQAAYECWKAGASIIHLHVRDDAGKPTQSVARFQEVFEKIRKRCPVILQISTGGAVGESIESRLKPLDLKPEMASLNMGSINFGTEVFQNLPQDIEAFAKRMQELNIMPELEVYDVGMLEYAKKLAAKGILKEPFHFQFVLGTPQGLTGEPRNLNFLVDNLFGDHSWAVAGVGRWQLPLAAQAIVRGGHVRVGFEDNIYFSKGVLAKSNAEFVSRVVELAKLLQRPVATVDEAREMLGLRASVS